MGRHLSVRWKLTLWYSFMCAATLALVAVGMRSYLNYRVQQEIQTNLQATAAEMSTVLEHPGKLPSEGRVPPLCVGTLTRPMPVVLTRYCRQIQQVMDLYSAQLSRPGQFPAVLIGSPYALNSILIEAARHRGVGLTDVAGVNAQLDTMTSGTPHLLNANGGGEQFRVYLSRVQPPARVRTVVAGVVLEVYQNEHTYRSIQNELDLILLLGIPIGLIIATVVGWWIARAALRPINRISRTVRSIGESRDLSRRLRFVGPHDEVGRLADTFDGMMERLEKSFENQKRFIADASHELRTPLTAIRGNADLMRIAPPDERDVCLAAIRREAERMSRLVTDLLLLAEADVEEHPVDKRPVDLDQIVADVYQAALVLAADRVSVTLERADPVCLAGDADRLKQLILNLADNAVKFTPDGGAVSLSLQAEEDGALIEVADSGIGIPPEDQEAIFERFYRVEQSRARKGSGLGLAICAWIVHAHGGSIDVRSAPGKGSTFSVRLPGRLDTTPELKPSGRSQPKESPATP